MGTVMELDEIRERIQMRELMEERARESYAPSTHPCEGMSLQEVLNFVNYLMESLQKKDSENKAILQKLDSIMTQLEEARAENRQNAENVNTLTSLLNGMTAERDRLRLELEKKAGENAVNRKFRFGGHSQKGTSVKKQAGGRDDGRDDFDGTQNPGVGTPETAAPAEAEDPVRTEAGKTRPERRGMKYNTMDARCKKIHPCDRSRLPEGSVIVSTQIRKVFDRVCYVVEHDFEYITYRLADGSMRTDHFPMEGDTEPVRCIPGTHATADLLSNLAFNKYGQMTPLYREINRFRNENMLLSRQTLTNWLGKAAEMLEELLPSLKAKALAPGSIVNVDETWNRLHLVRKSGKVYIWCLVNRLAKTVIFFYDEGSRGRSVLKDFIGDAELAALQSDGYNAYNYIDNQLVKIEHICCLAHARAKFKYAQEQGQDDRATYFLERIAKLYQLENGYKRQNLSSDEIKTRRNSAETADILTEMRCELKRLRDDGSPKGNLMEKALNYLDHFWTQIFNYRKDGRYSIDNSIAEQCIRPLTRERSNSIHFASHRGAEVSAIFHTIFSTCRMAGVSALDYLKQFFEAMLSGRTDYDNLLPSTIGLKSK